MGRLKTLFSDFSHSVNSLSFSAWSTLSPKTRPVQLLCVWLDACIINVLFYFFLRAVLFLPIELSSSFQVVALGIAFTLVSLVLYGMQPWPAKKSWLKFIAYIVAIFCFVDIVAGLADILILRKAHDWSWLRVEMIKTPYWLRMYTALSPGFVVFFIIVASALIWISLSNPRSRILAIAPGLFTIALIIRTFIAFSGFPEGIPQAITFTVMFCGPTVVFAFVCALRFYGTAFRLLPFILHTLLINFNYIGILPVQSYTNLLPFSATDTTFIEKEPGVRMLTTPGDPAHPGFPFIRTLVSTESHLYASYGPTCGIFQIDRNNGSFKDLQIPGSSIRDLRISPDGNYLWGLDTRLNEFNVVDLQSFEHLCEINMYDIGLPTPWAFDVKPAAYSTDKYTVYISNMTMPIIAEVEVTTNYDGCAMHVRRMLDFNEIGFTKFTDGVYGVHYDPGHDRLYVQVGLLELSDLTALVEIDLDTFTISREVRIPHGTGYIIPLPNRNNVMIPGYWGKDIYEVSLDTMTIIRSFPAEPTIRYAPRDNKRGLLYATSRTSAELLVIEDASGRILKRIPVGAKPDAVHFDASQDIVYVGSKAGIVEIYLPEFLADVDHLLPVDPL